MFIENAYKGKSDAWRYIVGIFLIILIYFMASMPFGIALMAEAGAGKLAGMSETEMLSVLEPNTTLFYMLLPFAFAFFGILTISRLLHDQPLKFLVTSRSSFDWSRVAFSFLIVTVLAVLSLAIDLALSPRLLIYDDVSLCTTSWRNLENLLLSRIANGWIYLRLITISC